jgi:hypothetical protein
MICYLQTTDETKLIRIDRDTVNVVNSQGRFTVADFNLTNTLTKDAMKAAKIVAKQHKLKLVQPKRMAIRTRRDSDYNF